MDAKDAAERLRGAGGPDGSPDAGVPPEGRLAAIIRALPEIAFLLDEDGRYLDVLGGEEALLPGRRARLVGRTLHEVLPAELADRALRVVRAAIATGTVQGLEYPLESSTGLRWYEGRCGPVPDEPSGPRHAIFVARDVTRRNAADDALRRSQARLHTVVESLPFDVWLLEPDGRYGMVNSVSRTTWGRDALGRTPREIAPTPEMLATWEAQNARARKGEVVSEENVWPLRGETRHILNIVCPVREEGPDRAGAPTPADAPPAILGIGIDLTEQRRLAEQLQRAQRLESIGLLAGGIAHDFNNILTSIVGSIALARLNARDGGDVDDLLAGAEKACLRARSLTKQLLTFSRGGAPVKETGSIGALVRETAEFVLRGSAVGYDVQIAADLWPASFDEGQMSQVFNNLLINAVQAMPRGGRIRIAARNLTVAPEAGAAAAGSTRPGPGAEAPALALDPGRWIEIAVSDEGVGIPPEHLDRVFDPYFTTKSDGSGLGLATSYSIVRRHGGFVTVRSCVGTGTTATVLLPAADEDAAAALPAQAAARPAQPPRPAGGGRVLVMDDQPAVRETIAHMLGRLGYAAVLAPDGEAAIARYEETLRGGRPYDLVIMDLTVPGGMSGREAAGRIRALDPHARLVASSGYSTDPVMADPRAFGFDAVLPKPFFLEDLVAVMARVESPEPDPPADPPAEPLADPPAEPLADPPAEPLADPPAEPLADPPAEPLADPPADPLAEPPAEPLADPPADPSQ
jgi:PAS domain S-box-containing protein